MLNINKAVDDRKALIALEGRLDTATAPELEHVLSKTMHKIDELTLDFEKLDYISSAGLRVLLTAQKQMSQQGGMKLIHVNETIMDVFEITGFSDILTIE
ncbi:MAG: STAS domain-containing protein [Oscillospiraceae bacterium]|nr:STAS domain-containing protein [Oscillospiraceae bacterium]